MSPVDVKKPSRGGLLEKKTAARAKWACQGKKRGEGGEAPRRRWKVAPGPFTRMACQGFHLLRTRPGTPDPLLMVVGLEPTRASADKSESLTLPFTIIEAPQVVTIPWAPRASGHAAACYPPPLRNTPIRRASMMVLVSPRCHPWVGRPVVCNIRGRSTQTATRAR